VGPSLTPRDQRRIVRSLQNRRTDPIIEHLGIIACTVPTDFPEADGTLEWNSTTLVMVEAQAGGKAGVGYTYASAATAQFIDELLAQDVIGKDPFALPAIWESMARRIRNQGRPGISSMAIAAVDSALWDLKAKLLDVPLVRLLGPARDRLPVYGSGGFTSYSIIQLQRQLGDWIEDGIPRVKMKIGLGPTEDLERVKAAREAIGTQAELYVDANSAYDVKEALLFMQQAAEFDVSWMEQPIAPEDLAGLRLLRERAPDGIEIADGEYGYDLPYFRRMLEAGGVDVLMPDATRCGGITGFMRAGALCEAFRIPLSSHCAPSLHLHAGCALPWIRHAEYFHDHARIEQMLFEGALKPVQGELHPDLSRPGLGIELKQADAERFVVYRGGRWNPRA
jgi:L-alanine-DL-glutamate epimerase-like enolase superfamily enzyme